MWNTKSVFLKNAMATILKVNIMKVNEDWCCQCLK